jgi:hypothetical protein
MPSATVPGSYAFINIIFDPPYFSLDSTFKETIYENCVYGRPLLPEDYNIHALDPLLLAEKRPILQERPHKRSALNSNTSANLRTLAPPKGRGGMLSGRLKYIIKKNTSANSNVYSKQLYSRVGNVGGSFL